MRLEAVFADNAAKGPGSLPTAQSPEGTIHVDEATRRLVGIRIAQVENRSLTSIIRGVGRVLPEDTRVYKVNCGVDGFVRQTYNDSVGMPVKKNQKLASYYGPEFLAASSGFLAATERVPGSVGKDGARFTPEFPGAIAKEGVRSIQGYTDRLRNLGMSDVQIKQVAESRQLPESIDVVSPADGFILARNITPGQHFERLMEFYRIADLSRVWVVAELSEQEAPHLRPGGLARIVLRDEGRQLPARIADSLPQSEAGGGTVKLRLEAENPRFVLRPDMLVDVELQARLPSAVTVPVDALVDSGTKSRVYVETGEGIFEPREVETGWRSEERIQILQGLRPGERVVAAATFLIDSESRLKTPASGSASLRASDRPAAIHLSSAVVKTASDPRCGMPVDPAEAAASANTIDYRGTTYYFCSRRCKQAFQDEHSGAGSKRQSSDD
jgi:Cu(I)/Ag(I) efflux system membrane fusion protein